MLTGIKLQGVDICIFACMYFWLLSFCLFFCFFSRFFCFLYEAPRATRIKLRRTPVDEKKTPTGKYVMPLGFSAMLVEFFHSLQGGLRTGTDKEKMFVYRF